MNTVLTLNDYQYYLNEVKKYPIISDDEEHELALDFFYNKTIESAHKLIVSNLRYVVKIANSYQYYNFPIMDLIQEGNIGLMKAVKKFDPNRGIKLISYAVYWIRAYITRYIQQCWNMVKINTTANSNTLFYDTDNVKHLDKFSQKEIDDVKMRKQRDVYLYDSIYDNGMCPIDILSSNEQNADIQIEMKQADVILNKKVTSAIETLNAREKHILEYRIMGEERKTYKELANELNISIQRISEIEGIIKLKLKKLLQ